MKSRSRHAFVAVAKSFPLLLTLVFILPSDIWDERDSHVYSAARVMPTRRRATTADLCILNKQSPLRLSNVMCLRSQSEMVQERDRYVGPSPRNKP